MKIAIISDLHGYKLGFDWAVSQINALSPDEVWCLGDIVDGGGHDLYVIEGLIALNTFAVRGNHDEYNDLNLPRWAKCWLSELPIDIKRHGWWLTHASPRHLSEQIRDGISAWNAFDDCDFDSCIVGHSHISAVYRYKKEMGVEAECLPFVDESVSLELDYRHLVVCPSLAYNRIHHGHSYSNPAMLILDQEEKRLTLVRSDLNDMKNETANGSADCLEQVDIEQLIQYLQ